MRYLLGAVAILSLTSCGGGRLSGPISAACLQSDRSAANTQVCSCIQGAANDGLSRGDQRRAAAFWDDPQRAQDTRTSDRAGDEAFWTRYRAFADRAERICR
ncbi:arginine transporter [Pseudoroseicyclus aestuarii]|uniref:Arginine transporter n=1 Tax=Pseudoroseicyclus aestuarii TaxID=1795041 RepID=A0A318SYI3_9RHOB|nr:arginine transporter [Pseudoroseicyclus aestuarii]PYE85416.1 hypothetical protein DFP88_10181 [Pseudoroseicyclus aestuarii]